MTWLEIPVKFTCPLLTRSSATPTRRTPQPAEQPWTLPLAHGSLSLNRHKRDAHQPVSYDPRILCYNWYYYGYCMHMMRQAQASGTTTAMSAMYYYPFSFPYYHYHGETVLVSTTMSPATTTSCTTTGMATGSATTAKSPQEPQYPIINGMLPYQQTTRPPAVNATSSVKPTESSLKTTTSGSPSTTTTACKTATNASRPQKPEPTNDEYPGPTSPYAPDYKQTSVAFQNKEDKRPDGDSDMPPATYEQGPMPQSYRMNMGRLYSYYHPYYHKYHGHYYYKTYIRWT